MIWVLLSKSLAPAGPKSVQQIWTRPPWEVLMAEESMDPERISPSSITMCASLTVMYCFSTLPLSSLSTLYWFSLEKLILVDGIANDRICFPVQSGPELGDLIMAGIGMRPSKSGTCIMMFIIRSFSTKVLRRDSELHPSSVSWTIPMTGWFFCGETIWKGTIMTLEISDLVSYDWGRCRFISSPSKSALYGEVTERLSRNVEYGMIFTRCPIIDILCSDGCRLKITQSSSCICRSTTYP
mmetsp:Transcript_600/g.1256  ORF Transcript_600/g.1256 Transcript_600/m.1256 type:complete len:240 (+) Transcript_600:3273-3992(+)